MRLAKSEIESYASTVGEINCIKWKDIIFSWTGNYNNVDEYTANGYFVGVHPKYMYEKLIIMADFAHQVYHLKTGRGKEITYIDMLDLTLVRN
jgi:hypothetical protein